MAPPQKGNHYTARVLMKRAVATLILTALIGLTAQPTAPAAEPDKPVAGGASDPASVPKPGAKARPLAGRIAEVDQVNKTLKVGKTVVYITSETRITKDGKPAVLADAKPGDEVGISYVPGENGRYIARSVRIGPKPGSANKPSKGGNSKQAPTDSR